MAALKRVNNICRHFRADPAEVPVQNWVLCSPLSRCGASGVVAARCRGVAVLAGKLKSDGDAAHPTKRHGRSCP